MFGCIVVGSSGLMPLFLADNGWGFVASSWRKDCLFSSAAISVPPFSTIWISEVCKLIRVSSEQNLMLSPSMLGLLSAFCFDADQHSGAIFFGQSEQRKLFYFLMIWLHATYTCVSSFSFQRWLIAGYQFPLRFWRHTDLRESKADCNNNSCFVGIHALVTFQQIQDIRSKMPYYLPLEYKEAFEWMAKQDGRSV
jgi:hypothetical protein